MENGLINSFEKEWDKAKTRFFNSESQLQGLLLPEFFCRHTLEVAEQLLGKIVWVKTRPEYPFEHPSAGLTAGRIVETEAYRADDPASHSCRGETPRSTVMFGEPGNAYIYFIYGMYEMLNFVTEPKGEAGAVLIRAIEPLFGLSLMNERRKNPKLFDLTRGPGRVCQAMGIRMEHNKQPLQGPVLYVSEDDFQVKNVLKSGRVGIRQGKEKLWRFFIDGSPFVSRGP